MALSRRQLLRGLGTGIAGVSLAPSSIADASIPRGAGATWSADVGTNNYRLGRERCRRQCRHGESPLHGYVGPSDWQHGDRELCDGRRYGNQRAGLPARAGKLTIAPGSRTATIPVVVVGDTLREPSQSYRVDLKAARNETLLDASDVGRISDNDKGKR